MSREPGTLTRNGSICGYSPPDPIRRQSGNDPVSGSVAIGPFPIMLGKRQDLAEVPARVLG
jgi:hypothetical protein